MTQQLTFAILSTGFETFKELRGTLAAQEGARLLVGGDDPEQIFEEIVRMAPNAAVVSLSARPGPRVAGSVPGAGPAGGLAPADAAGEGGECAILEMVLRHGTPTVRPDDVLAGLRSVCGLEAAAAPFHERLAQGPLDTVTGTVGDPLALNRDTA